MLLVESCNTTNNTSCIAMYCNTFRAVVLASNTKQTIIQYNKTNNRTTYNNKLTNLIFIKTVCIAIVLSYLFSVLHAIREVIILE